MSILRNIQTYFFSKKIKAAQQTKQRTGHTIESAKTIVLLFDATNQADTHTMQAQRDHWVNSGKKVYLIGFDAKKNAVSKTSEHLTLLTSKEFGWYGTLKGEQIKLPKECDLLLAYNPLEQRPIHFLTATIAAAMKVGSTIEEGLPNSLDLTIELPEKAKAKDFLESVALYLNKIKQSNT